MNEVRIAILLFFLAFPIALQSQSLTSMTFNIRYDNPADSLNSWNHRKEAVVELIEQYSPGVFGIQEGLQHQVLYLQEKLSKYQFIGVGREDGKAKGEYAAIFYDKTKYHLLSSGTFWLSERPDTVSIGWDAALERICTYGLFKDKKSGKKFWFFNTHFDHMGELARQNSAKLILQKMEAFNEKNHPVILCGDFNASAGSEPIRILQEQLSEASEISEQKLYGPAGTYNEFKADNSVTECIDFMFVKNLKVRSIAHIDDSRNNNRVISDHYPVLVELGF